MDKQKSMGFMWLARRPCGRISAAAWDRGWKESQKNARTAEWIARGDTVERIERFEDEPLPEWICYPGCDCLITKHGLNMPDEITVRSAKLSEHDYLLYVDKDSMLAHVETAEPGWTSLGRIGEPGLLVDQSEWPRFAALVAAVSELREARRLSAEAWKVDNEGA